MELIGMLKHEVYDIIYHGLRAKVHSKDIADALNALSAMNRNRKRSVLKSVEKSLTSWVKKANTKKALSEEEKRNCANDIAIWFANEMIEGRAESYKQDIN